MSLKHPILIFKRSEMEEMKKIIHNFKSLINDEVVSLKFFLEKGAREEDYLFLLLNFTHDKKIYFNFMNSSQSLFNIIERQRYDNDFIITTAKHFEVSLIEFYDNLMFYKDTKPNRREIFLNKALFPIEMNWRHTGIKVMAIYNNEEDLSKYPTQVFRSPFNDKLNLFITCDDKYKSKDISLLCTISSNLYVEEYMDKLDKYCHTYYKRYLRNLGKRLNLRGKHS